MSYSLTKKRRQLYTYDISQNQITFTGQDSVSNTLDFPTGSTVKVYHNDLYVNPTDYTISGNSIVFSTAPNTDGGTHTLKVIVQSDMTTMNDYAITIKASAETKETYLIENDPNYDPNDTNTYYSKIRIEDDYLTQGEWSSKDFALGTAMDAITDAKAYTNAEMLAEISRATEAKTDLDTRLAILEAASNTGYVLNTFTATQGQTTFNLQYDVGMIAVFINGILLDGSDFTATDGATVVLTEAADAGDIISIPEYSSTGNTGSGSGTMSVSEVAPSNPSIGDMWFDPSTLTGLIYYNDGSSSQWVPINSVGAQGPEGTSSIATYSTLTNFPTAADLGDMAYALDTNLAYVYNGTQWQQISSSSSSTGNEAYDNFGTSTSYNPGGAITHGSYIRNEADTADVAASVTVTSGFSKIKVELDASIANITDATTEMLIALERTVDGSNPTTVKVFLFPVANTFYGSQHFLYIDTHGASAGSTVEYKLKVDMSSYSNESARVQFGICGDTLYIKEIA